ncbi:MAG TPA: aminotransferase class I/II-fold pyridoxal phosphate-dependent enzyme [Clostridia bacterium]|nr:aminotransferase class I/II-fold pyridoxal phosphate-dependent enzyme [Clostridia bacterium]
MSLYREMERAALLEEYSRERARFEGFATQKLRIDMSRGKPGDDQLYLSTSILNTVTDETGYLTEEGFDCRNYGTLTGLSECKRLFAEILELHTDNIIVGGNSSLQLMFDYITQCLTKGVSGCPAWSKQGKIRFLCPAPGYDRHFAICEYYGIDMINIDMNSDGPDVKMIEEYVKDESVKGMFCVPKYSNPQGITYSNEVVKRIAALKPAAKDFRIIWDDAYCVHDFTDNPDKLLSIYPELLKNGNEDMVVQFASTSKMTFPGAGVAVIGTSKRNIEEISKRLFYQIISYDKINQLRHARYFKDLNGLKKHMKLHAEILKPKFSAVLDTLDKEFSGKGIVSYNIPSGGYFISLDVIEGSALRVGGLCKEVGLKLTSVGATYPYGIDPFDRNIRIAPTYPPIDELKTAAEILCVSVKLACLEAILNEK